MADAVQGPREPSPAAVKAASPWKTLRRLLVYIINNHPMRLLLVMLCILVSALAGVAGSLFIGTLIDTYITPLLGHPNPSFTPLLHAVGIMAIIYYTGVLASFTQARMMIVISQDTQRDIRDDMFSHMQTLPIKYFDTHSFGDLMSRYTNDTDTLRQMLSQSIPQMLLSVVTIVVVFFAMLHVSTWLTGLVMVVVAIALIASRRISSKSSVYFKQQQATLGEANGYIEEMINGQKVIKVFSHEPQTMDRFAELNDRLFYSASNANKYANILMPVMINMGNIQFVLVAVVGGLIAVSGSAHLTLGAIASFLQLSRSFSMPINQVSQQVNSVIQALAGAERIFTLLDAEPEGDTGYVTLVKARRIGDQLAETTERTGLWAWKHPHSAGGVTYTELTGDVRFEDVDFGYEPGKLVLHDISLYATTGEKVAFVGSTGAGKTTLTNLINRFYDISDGKIRYDGINISKIRKADLRRSLGMVLQDTNLFTGTIRENIRYGRPEATDDEILAAARMTNADNFIRMLPDGYDTVLSNDGSELSQGQRQLIAIARAAVADPPVMILDEATSSIDTRTEAIVQKGMDSLMKGRTVFVIAHRLSTVRNSDVIMVMEHGRIIKRGPHDYLMSLHGTYYQLYTGAFELQ
ncbi:MAG: ABC transporter ATP-binding protein/permease [Planctomycetaceae bacterium]|nr:ABC transporter ATP-binding protein/permease [Planctomycetaceae bacterium]